MTDQPKDPYSPDEPTDPGPEPRAEPGSEPAPEPAGAEPLGEQPSPGYSSAQEYGQRYGQGPYGQQHPAPGQDEPGQHGQPYGNPPPAQQGGPRSYGNAWSQQSGQQSGHHYGNPYGQPGYGDQYGQPGYEQQYPQSAYGPPQQPEHQRWSGQQHYPGMPGTDGGGSAQTSGFFGALFDFSFTRFATPMITKVVYVLLAVAIVLWYLVISVSAFRLGAAFGVVWLLIIGPIVALAMLALVRLTLEFYQAVVRIAQDVREMKADRSSEGGGADHGR